MTLRALTGCLGFAACGQRDDAVSTPGTKAMSRTAYERFLSKGYPAGRRSLSGFERMSGMCISVLLRWVSVVRVPREGGLRWPDEGQIGHSIFPDVNFSSPRVER